MAVATRETIIANPARKGKMTAKQIKFFGTKRQRAALKAKRKRPAAKKHRARTRKNPVKNKLVIVNRARKRRNAAKGSGRVISGYGSTVMNPRRRKRKNGAAKRKTRKKNPGLIYALANPATKGRKSMARTKRRKTSAHRAAGSTRRRKSNPARHHRRRPNPGMGVAKDWLSLGAGAIVGGVGATKIPQLLLSTSNTGIVGYIGNLAATGLLAVAANMVMKGNKSLVAGIVAGGVGATIRRVLGDYSVLGQYAGALGLNGMGDYLASDFLTPQTVVNGPSSAQLGKPSWANVAPPAAAVNVGGAGMGGYLTGRPLY